MDAIETAGATKAVHRLTEWAAGRPDRSWTLQNLTDNPNACIRLQMQEGHKAVATAVSKIQFEAAQVDILDKMVEDCCVVLAGR